MSEKTTIETMLKDQEQLRMLVRALVNTFGVDIKNKIIGYNQETKETIVKDGRQVRISKDSIIAISKNMALGLDWDEETSDILLFTCYMDNDKDGARYDN